MYGHPGEKQGNAGIGLDMFRFATAEIGEEDKALCIESFQENHSLPGLSDIVHGGQRHGVGLNNFQFLGLREPGLELINGIGGQILSMKARSCILLP